MLSDMTELNQKRFKIYVVFFAIFLLIAAGGYMAMTSGHGSIGKTRKELEPYVTRFNSLASVRSVNNSKSNSMKASITSEGILVTYKKDTSTSKVTFVFKEGAFKELEASYNRKDTDAEQIVKNMIDAVSVSRGNIEGSLFNEFEYDYFLNTTISQGLHLEATATQITAQINLETNLLKNIRGEGYQENKEEEKPEFEIVYDNTNTFETYADYKLPDGFSTDTNDHQIATETNTCTARFNIISSITASDASSFSNALANAYSAETIAEDINNTIWYKTTYANNDGGKTTYYTIDKDGQILGFEYQVTVDNSECDEYLEKILETIKLK